MARATDEPGLYQRVLGADWDELDGAVQQAHLVRGVAAAHGRLRVRHGSGWLVRWLLRAARLPHEAEAVETYLSVQAQGSVEVWRRTFGQTRLESTQRRRADGLLVERFGSFEILFRLMVLDGELTHQQVGLALAIGRFRLSIPLRLAPRVAAREAPAGPGRTHLTVQVAAPGGRPLLAYEGEVQWAAASP